MSGSKTSSVFSAGLGRGGRIAAWAAAFAGFVSHDGGWNVGDDEFATRAESSIALECLQYVCALLTFFLTSPCDSL